MVLEPGAFLASEVLCVPEFLLEKWGERMAQKGGNNV